MNLFFKSLVFVCVVMPTGFTYAKKKADKKTMAQLKTDISFLASDQLEGRRTGTEGERLAAEFIESRYKKLNIAPWGATYKHPFSFNYGREIGKDTKITINDQVVKLKEEGFPFPFSASKSISAAALPEVTEQGNIWAISLYTDSDQAKDPHFDPDKRALELTRDAIKGGATGVVLFDAYNSKYSPAYNMKSELDAVEIPVVFLNHTAYKKYIKSSNQSASLSFNIKVQIDKVMRNGTNIAAYIDNHATYTVVLGAHYDHLGYGEDGNSLFANATTDKQIHHGADDNASGTAALMELAKRVKKQNLHNFNYLFLHFSGEELGLYGSKSIVKQEHIDSSKFAYMLNMDMVGRLNDSTHALTLGGLGTSPSWEPIAKMATTNFKIVADSSGFGPSDHTSFYTVGIPVLFLFTGQHKDYHKPTDVASSINYPGEVSVINYADAIVQYMDQQNVKPKYLVTKQSTGGRSKFKVTLGIMPDYAYHDGGVKVDGVSDGKPASKAGVKSGDIVLQLGDIKIQSMSSYMEALGKFAPGDVTTVKVMRDGKEVVMPLEFNK